MGEGDGEGTTGGGREEKVVQGEEDVGWRPRDEAQGRVVHGRRRIRRGGCPGEEMVQGRRWPSGGGLREEMAKGRWPR